MKCADLRFVGLIGAVLFAAAACASAQGPGREAPPTANAIEPPSFSVVSRGQFECIPEDIFRSRFWSVSGSGAYFLLKVQCYRGRRYLGDFLEIVDLNQNTVVAHAPFIGGMMATASRTALAIEGDESFLIAGADSSGHYGEFATHVRFERRELPSGRLIERGTVELEARRPSAVIAAANSHTLLVLASDSLGAFENVDYLHRIDLRLSDAEVTAIPTDRLASISNPHDLMGRHLLHVPTQDGRLIGLIEANGVFPHQPNEVENSAIRMGVGRFVFDFGLGEVVWPAVTAAQAGLVEQGHGLHSVSRDGRFVAIIGGGDLSIDGAPRQPGPCGGHVRSLPSFTVVGRLPCAPDDVFAAVEYRTGVMTFSSDGGLLATPRGNSGWLDVYSLTPWRQLQRISARELGLDEILVVAAHPTPRTFVVGGLDRWMLIRFDEDET